MPDSVEVIVPVGFRGCHYREAAWAWCRTRYEHPVVEAFGPDPWVKALAVMPAVERSEAEVLILADADVHCDPSEAIQAVIEGASWARPHNRVIRLTQDGTRAYMDGEPWEHFPVDRPVYYGLDCGGMFVTRRESLLEAPMDPRFTGWGSEDWALGFAFLTLYGQPWVGTDPLIHLWHPPQAKEPGDKYGSPENQALWKRYANARSYEEPMKQLLQEARDALDLDKPSSDDHPKALVV